MTVFGQNSAFLVSMTIYIELDEHMVYQNDALYETGNLKPHFF